MIPRKNVLFFKDVNIIDIILLVHIIAELNSCGYDICFKLILSIFNFQITLPVNLK